MSLIVKNCDWVITQNSSREILRNCSVRVEDGRIVEVGQIQGSAEHMINGSGKVLLPGLILSLIHISEPTRPY